jgi:nucleotide-binding universal stress UspA family protein
MAAEGHSLVEAIDDFKRMRFRAKVEQVLARFKGESVDLLEYDQVRKKLRARGQVRRGLRDVPIDAIVGSVGRYTDFTRSFLPRQDDDLARWAKVKIAMSNLAGLPPIELYQVGEAYFVLDGNHRISVARQLEATHIQAYVTEIQTRVPLSPDVRPEDLVVKAEYVDFLDRTQLDRIRPEAELSVSVPGQYRKLEEHISVHHYFMGLDQKRRIPYEEAVGHWYDTVYLPMVQVIREQGVLRDFAGRTETDLYLWILEHRAALGQDLHWEIEPETAAQDLVDRYSSRPGRIVARVGGRLSHAMVPRTMAAGPPPGAWRDDVSRRSDRLFTDVLVAISGTEGGWRAVEQALRVSQREDGRLIGLHVVSSEAERESEAVQALEAEFKGRCAAAGIPDRWIVETGNIAARICDWSRWSSLAVVSLAYPPGDQFLSRLGSGIRALVQHCPVPILAVPRPGCAGSGTAEPGASEMQGAAGSEMRRLLLAYDGSPKAQEALFVSTYLAGQWEIPLAVVAVVEQERTTPETVAMARAYLEEHGVQATFVGESVDKSVGEPGDVSDVILRAAREQQSELIVMGGYGFSPMLEIVLGSTVDHILRSSHYPVLICR